MLDAPGERVYEHNQAYYSNAFRACLLAKARPLSSLPIHVYRREEDGTRVDADDSAARGLERLLRGRWNPLLTGSEGLRWLMMTKDTKGNAFVRVEWGADGAPTALWPLAGEPSIVSYRAGGEPVFSYGGDEHTPAGNLLANEVVWVKSPIIDADGVRGVSLALLAANELGLSIDLEEFYQRLLSNGSHFPGWLETPNKLTDADVTKLKAQLSDGQGILSAGRVRIFDKGLTYHQSDMSITDMSLVDQEKWILQQTCRTLSVPPQEVFDLSNATYSNIEQGAINFANKTLVPECVAIEQAFNDVLRSAGAPSERDYVQIDMNGLLRGSYRERMEGYRASILGGFMSPNMALRKEDEKPYKGGEVFFRSGAYIPVDPETGEETVPRSSSQPEPGAAGESGSVEALAPVKEDMDARVAQRFRDQGDCERARSFARDVLGPYARAAEAAGLPYDIESDIERLAGNA